MIGKGTFASFLVPSYFCVRSRTSDQFQEIFYTRISSTHIGLSSELLHRTELWLCPCKSPYAWHRQVASRIRKRPDDDSARLPCQQRGSISARRSGRLHQSCCAVPLRYAGSHLPHRRFQRRIAELRWRRNPELRWNRRKHAGRSSLNREASVSLMDFCPLARLLPLPISLRVFCGFCEFVSPDPRADGGHTRVWEIR